MYILTICAPSAHRHLREHSERLTIGGGKSIRVDSRYIEAMLNTDGTNVYTKTKMTSDKEFAGEIYVGREELKVDWAFCHARRRRHAFGNRSRCIGTRTRHKGKKDPI